MRRQRCSSRRLRRASRSLRYRQGRRTATNSAIELSRDLTLGAIDLGGGSWRFRVWAPLANQVDVHIEPPDGRLIALAPSVHGYWEAGAEGLLPGTTYFVRLDGEQEFPDPASRYQPRGVHGPSALVGSDFPWTDADWQPPALPQQVIYELHVGTFTPQGSFESVLTRLPHLKSLGITTIEVMPIGQFPGGRNWGYDGVLAFAAQDSYGGPDGFRRLVDGCHAAGLAVILDVVYNHVGPEGAHLSKFGPYFSQSYHAPWGEAINFDGPDSDEVRRYFIESALYWARTCHVDGFRLDAVHAIFDPTAYPFLEQLGDVLHAEGEARGKAVTVIAESSLNDPRLVLPKDKGGFALDGFWNDDFHHSVHTLLTGENRGYYEDFGRIELLARTLRDGLAFAGDYSAFRRRRHGRASRDLKAQHSVVAIQNHDQVGNRMLGERLSALVSFEALKLAAALLLLPPQVPLLFMGEEYGETAPFHYFVSHTEPELIEAVRQGRKREFASFGWESEAPDPQSTDVFEAAKLDWQRPQSGEHATLLAFYTELIKLRKSVPALANLTRVGLVIDVQGESLLTMRRTSGVSEIIAVFNLGAVEAVAALEPGAGSWHKRVDSGDERWVGPGSAAPERLTNVPARIGMLPCSVVMYESEPAK